MSDILGNLADLLHNRTLSSVIKMKKGMSLYSVAQGSDVFSLVFIFS